MSVVRGAWVVWVMGVLVAPVTAVGQDAVDLTGEVRSRTEVGDPAGGDAGGFSLLRTRLGLTAEPLSYARVFAQVQDSRVWGEEAGTLEGSADAFDLHQGYVELFDEWARHGVKLRVGRQEIALGNERLVGAVGWSNVGRSFDGARLDLTGPGGWWSVTGFVTTVAETDAPPAGSGNAVFQDEFGDHTFAGVVATFQHYDLYVYQNLNDAISRRGPGPPSVNNIDRTTAGGRVHRRVGDFSYEFEGAYQLGDRLFGQNVDQDIRAWMGTGRVGYDLDGDTGPLRGLDVGLDWLSGDRDGRLEGNGDYEAFDILFHTGHKWYGFMDLFVNPARSTQNRGLVDAMATVRTSWGSTHVVPVTATIHRFTVAEDGPDLPDSDLGWELDVTAPYSLGDAGTLQAGYSVFFAGDAAQEVGLADADETRNWFYLQLTLGF